MNKQEAMNAVDEAASRIPSPTTFEEYSYSWIICAVCNKFSALSKKMGDPYVCPCGWSREKP